MALKRAFLVKEAGGAEHAVNVGCVQVQRIHREEFGLVGENQRLVLGPLDQETDVSVVIHFVFAEARGALGFCLQSGGLDGGAGKFLRAFKAVKHGAGCGRIIAGNGFQRLQQRGSSGDQTGIGIGCCYVPKRALSACDFL